MEQQNTTPAAATPTVTRPSVVAPAEPAIDPRKQTVIDYYAVQGVMTDDEGNIKRMTVSELANMIGVDRTRIYAWRDSIPDFWAKVEKARHRIGGQSRVQKVWNGIYMQAALGKPEQAKLYLANHDPGFRMPQDPKAGDTANTLIELMNAARRLQQEQNQAGVQGGGQDRVQVQQPLTAAPLPPNVIEGQTL